MTIQIKSRSKTHRFATRVGLTLVELLVIIAVIGFFSAMAIPTFKDIVSESVNATARSNAQNIALVASVAEVMGSGVFDEITSLDEAVDLITAGTDSRFTNASYSSGDLTEEEKQDAMRFLRFERGIVIYSGEANSTSSSSPRTPEPSVATVPDSNF